MGRTIAGMESKPTWNGALLGKVGGDPGLGGAGAGTHGVTRVEPCTLRPGFFLKPSKISRVAPQLTDTPSP